MASAEHPDSGDANALQFDHAEFTSEAPAAVVCGGCKRPIDDEYYEINQTLLCDPCRQAVSAHFQRGSKALRVTRATAFGLLAAALGSVILYAFGAITGYSVGIVSILVGYLVGRAVSVGSIHRGGLFYQLLAVFLTYSAVAWAYVPDVIQEVVKLQANKQADGAEGRGEAGIAQGGRSEGRRGTQEGSGQREEQAGAEPGPGAPERHSGRGGGGCLRLHSALRGVTG